MKTTKSRSILLLLLFLTALVLSACSQSPEGVREWMLDKRRPAKMREFILNERNTLETKIECLMVLIERNDCTKLPETLDKPLTTDEVNQIIAGAIPRMRELTTRTDAAYYATYVKDASYYLLKLKDILTEDNKAALVEFIRTWIDGPNFFLPIEKSGRVEQGRLYEEIGNQASIDVFKHALTTQLNNLDIAIEKEEAEIAAAQVEGKKFKVKNRPSEKITNNIATTFGNLDALKLPGANDMVAQLVSERIDKSYPNMPRALAIPFAKNDSAGLLDVAKRIILDPEYKNPTLNYFKDVMINTYYKKVQKDAGTEVCAEVIAKDVTGYPRWDCLEMVTVAKGREALADIISSIPDDPALVLTPEDHPTLVDNPALTSWNSMRVYCSHLNSIFNNQVPLDVFRQFIKAFPPVLRPPAPPKPLPDGTIERPDIKLIQRILSMACLVTLGTEEDVELLASYKNDKTDITEYKMKVPTIGELANYTSTLLDKRIENQKKAEAAAAAAAAAAANNPSDGSAQPGQPAPAAQDAQVPAAPVAAQPAPAAPVAAQPAPAAPVAAAPAPAAAPAQAAAPAPAPKPAQAAAPAPKPAQAAAPAPKPAQPAPAPKPAQPAPAPKPAANSFKVD